MFYSKKNNTNFTVKKYEVCSLHLFIVDNVGKVADCDGTTTPALAYSYRQVCWLFQVRPR